MKLLRRSARLAALALGDALMVVCIATDRGTNYFGYEGSVSNACDRAARRCYSFARDINRFA